jgi:hypothetical protein
MPLGRGSSVTKEALTEKIEALTSDIRRELREEGG